MFTTFKARNIDELLISLGICDIDQMRSRLSHRQCTEAGRNVDQV